MQDPTSPYGAQQPYSGDVQQPYPGAAPPQDPGAVQQQYGQPQYSGQPMAGPSPVMYQSATEYRTGFIGLSRRGTIEISGSVVRLLDRKGNELISAPASAVSVRRSLVSRFARVMFNGKQYRLSFRSMGSMMLIGGITGLVMASRGAKQFAQALQAAQQTGGTI